METTFQPMTKGQREQLQGYIGWVPAVGRVGLFIFASLLVGWIVRFVVNHTVADANYIWWLLPSFIIMVSVFIFSQKWTGGRQFRHAIRTDLHGEKVAVHRVEVMDAIEVEEKEDEGPSYFLNTADGEVILFTGQYLDDYKQRKFPWRSFEIIEAPNSRVFFGLKQLGNPFEPSAHRLPFNFAEFKKFGGKKYQPLDMSFGELKAAYYKSG